MSLSFALSLFFAAPPQPTCVPHGTPMLEIRERVDNQKAESATRIYATGAWTISGTGASQSGCFDRKELRAIRKAVQAAPWQVTQSPMACFAYDPTFTEYRVHGSLRFTERMCSGSTADGVTLQTIAFVKAELAAEIPAPVAPLFEIRHRTDGSTATSSTTLYADGTFAIRAIDGSVSSMKLDKRSLRNARDVIDQSPWTTTYSRVVCKAYSPSFTEYYINGRLVFTKRLCGAQRLDDKSLGAIAIVEKMRSTTLSASSDR